MSLIYFSLFALLVISTILLVSKNRNDYLVIGFVVGLVYFNIIPFVVFLLNDGTVGLNIESHARWAIVPDISNNPEMIIKYFLTLFTMLMSIFAYSKFPIVKYRQIHTTLTADNSKSALFFLLIFLILNVIKDMLIPASITHWAEKAYFFNAHFGLLAQIFNFFMVGIKFYLLIIGSTIYSSKAKLSLILLISAALIDVIFTANRIFSLLIGLVLIILFIQNRNYRALFLLGTFSIPLIIFMNLWPYIRSTMSYLPFYETMQKSLELLTYGPELIMLTIFSMVEGADFLVSFAIVEDFPNRYDYFYGTSLLKIFVLFIPRSIWEDKWDSVAIQMAQIYNPYNEGFSLATTLLGEIFANGGFIALILLPYLLLNIFAYVFKKLKGINSNVNYTFLAFAITFLSMRSNFSDTFLLLIAIAIFLLLMKFFPKIRFQL